MKILRSSQISEGSDRSLSERPLISKQPSSEPGVLLDDRLTVACGEGAVRLVQVQRAGKKPMTAQELLRGLPLAPGLRLQPSM